MSWWIFLDLGCDDEDEDEDEEEEENNNEDNVINEKTGL